MDKKTKLMIGLIAFVVVMTVVGVMYDSLSKSYVEEPTEVTENNEVIEAFDFTVLDNSGNEVSLFDFKGKPIVVNFWATWCGYCTEEFPYFENMYLKYKDDVEFLMVNLTDGQGETVESARDYISENGYTFPVYYDTSLEAATIYEAYSIPLTVVIDKNANVTEYHLGAITEEKLENYILKVLEG